MERDERIREEDPLFQTAVFGRMVEDFLQSEIGQYILGKALEEEEQNTLDLVKNCALWDKSQILDCQARIWRAQKFRQWLSEAIDAGEQALKLGEEQRHG